MELQYKGLRILSRYCSCQDSEFRSAMETSSVDIDKLLSKNFFLWIQCPKISLLLFKDGADLRMESFSCKQSPHTLLFGANSLYISTFLSLSLYISSFHVPSCLPPPPPPPSLSLSLSGNYNKIASARFLLVTFHSFFLRLNEYRS